MQGVSLLWLGLSLLVASGGARAAHCSASSCCRARALGHLSFRSCGTQARLPIGMWNLPWPGIKPLSPALTGKLLTTGTPGKDVFLDEGCRSSFIRYKVLSTGKPPFPYQIPSKNLSLITVSWHPTVKSTVRVQSFLPGERGAVWSLALTALKAAWISAAGLRRRKPVIWELSFLWGESSLLTEHQEWRHFLPTCGNG